MISRVTAAVLRARAGSQLIQVRFCSLIPSLCPFDRTHNPLETLARNATRFWQLQYQFDPCLLIGLFRYTFDPVWFCILERGKWCQY